MSGYKNDLLSGIFLFFVGLFIALKSLQYSVWSRLGPDAGFFPLLISLVMMGTSALLVTKSSMRARQGEGRKMPMAKDDVFRVLAYGILMLFYAVFIGRVGFLISTSLFLFLILKYVERDTWKTLVLFSLGVVILSYVIFDYLLGVPLPHIRIKW